MDILKWTSGKYIDSHVVTLSKKLWNNITTGMNYALLLLLLLYFKYCQVLFRCWYYDFWKCKLILKYYVQVFVYSIMTVFYIINIDSFQKFHSITLIRHYPIFFLNVYYVYYCMYCFSNILFSQMLCHE